jgi:hypothetical protein
MTRNFQPGPAFSIPDPESRSRGQKSTESRIQIRNTANTHLSRLLLLLWVREEEARDILVPMESSLHNCGAPWHANPENNKYS